MVTHISKEAAVLNVRTWALDRGWSLAKCAEEMGLKTSTLKTWMRNDGWKCETRRVWVKKGNPDEQEA